MVDDQVTMERQDVEMCLLTFDGVPEVSFPVPSLLGTPPVLYHDDRRAQILEAIALLSPEQRGRLTYLPGPFSPYSPYGPDVPLYSVSYQVWDEE